MLSKHKHDNSEKFSKNNNADAEKDKNPESNTDQAYPIALTQSKSIRCWACGIRGIKSMIVTRKTAHHKRNGGKPPGMMMATFQECMQAQETFDLSQGNVK